MLSAVPFRPHSAVLLVSALLPSQTGTPRYTAAMLSCAVFQETVDTRIRNQSGTVARDETAGRAGILILTAAESDSGRTLTVWYDSLSLWREGPEGRDAPDTEGLLGGRWQGRLASDGRYTPGITPFVPDQVADISDLRGVPNDFLPVLDPATLQAVPGTAGGAGRARFTWTMKARADTTGMADTLKVPLRRDAEEAGSLVWDSRRGPIHWERTIKIDGRIEAGGAIKRGIRSLVTQHIIVERLADRPGCI